MPGLRRPECAVGLVLPVAHVDDGDLFGADGVGEDGVGGVLAGDEGDVDVAVVELLPLGDGVLHELLEGERAGELIGGGDDDVGQVAEYVEGVEDVVVMQLAQRGVVDAEEFVTDIVTIVPA